MLALSTHDQGGDSQTSRLLPAKYGQFYALRRRRYFGLCSESHRTLSPHCIYPALPKMDFGPIAYNGNSLNNISLPYAALRMRALQSPIGDTLPKQVCDGLISRCGQSTIRCFCPGSQRLWPSHCLRPAVVVVLKCRLFRRRLLPRQRQRQAALLPNRPASSSVAHRRQALPPATRTNSSPPYRPAAP